LKDKLSGMVARRAGKHLHWSSFAGIYLVHSMVVSREPLLAGIRNRAIQICTKDTLHTCKKRREEKKSLGKLVPSKAGWT
jgi:hypothetical protein